MPTDLRFDLDYLKQLVNQAMRLHRPCSVGEDMMLADIRGYFMYLMLDGLEDPSLATSLVDRFNTLQAWLEKTAQETAPWHSDAETIRFYLGWLFGLEQLLSLRHNIAKLPQEKISRQGFIRSWRETSRKLNLP